MSEYRTFVVPYDFSVHARAALFAAKDLGEQLNADLHLIHVIQPYAYTYGYGAYAAGVAAPSVDIAEVSAGVMKSLSEVARQAQGNFGGKVQPHVVEGAAIADVIRDSAEILGADLIVMGTHGRTGLAHVFLGSVAERTLRRAPCPVLTVQAPEEQDSEEWDADR